MRRTLTATLVTAALLLSNAAIVAAADFCLSLDSGANTLVFKAFALPTKGTCKETRGFYPPAPELFDPQGFWVAGLACGSSDGTRITFFHTGIQRDDSTGDFVFTDKFVLNRASLSGSGRACQVNTGGAAGCIPVTFTKIPCSPANFPVP